MKEMEKTGEAGKLLPDLFCLSLLKWVIKEFSGLPSLKVDHKNLITEGSWPISGLAKSPPVISIILHSLVFQSYFYPPIHKNTDVSVLWGFVSEGSHAT
jgi:hypothetical protein